MLIVLIIIFIVILFWLVIFAIFFDQAIIVRKDYIYRMDTSRKAVALTFDDGPSPIWTPKILDQLKEADVKAAFFMIKEYIKR